MPLVTPGAISLSNSSHFALMPYSNRGKPVALPPGVPRAGKSVRRSMRCASVPIPKRSAAP